MPYVIELDVTIKMQLQNIPSKAADIRDEIARLVKNDSTIATAAIADVGLIAINSITNPALRVTYVPKMYEEKKEDQC